jgi:signal transduction histidine kinase
MHTSGWEWLPTADAAELHEEDLRLRTVLGHCPRCIAVLDEGGNLVGYNTEFGALFSSPPQLGQSIVPLFEQRARAMLEQVIELAGTKQRAGAILSMRTKDGDDRDVEFLVATLPGEAKRSIGVVMAADDRTPHAIEEAERLALARNIGDANCNGAISLAQAALCHDVNDAMAIAALTLGSLRSHRLSTDPQAKELLANVAEAVSHASDIVRRAREVSGAAFVPSGSTDVKECVVRAIHVVTPLARARRVRITLQVHADAHVPVSGTELTQVVTNLLTNSIHAIEDAKRPGHIDITLTRATPSSVTISVRDDGVGIEPSHLLDSFEAFQTTRAAAGGTGLGLAISRRIIEAAGGRIDVVSAPGCATEMRLELPATTPTGASAATS